MQDDSSISFSQNDTIVESILLAVESRMIDSLGSRQSRESATTAPTTNSALCAGTYHLLAKGQRLRARLAVHAGINLGLQPSDIVSVAAAAELLHNASLIHDDIQDGDKIRRGQAAVWSRYGINTAICAGDLLISAAYSSACQISNTRLLPQMITLLHERICEAIEGQCADLSSSDNTHKSANITLDDYKRITIAKSGALLSLPLELSLILSSYESYIPVARQAMEAFSISYQILDDLNDQASDINFNGSVNTLNILSVLAKSKLSDKPEILAIHTALAQLDLATSHAANLPNHSGVLLTVYAAGLRQSLLQLQ